jgi:flagellar biosynthetic protein FliR
VLQITSAQLHLYAGALLFPFLRILALVFSAPMLGHTVMPVNMKVALSLLLALGTAALLPSPVALDSPRALEFGLRELAIGFSLGIAMQMVFAAAELAGDAVGLQMGLGFAFFVDPQHAGTSPLVGTFYSTLTALLFFALDAHLLMIAGVIHSFASFPVGSPLAMSDWHALAAGGAEMFRLALGIALPVIVGLMIANIGLGVLSRAAPQLNLFAVGFPATLIVGVLLLGPSLPGAVDKLTRAFEAWPWIGGR